MGLKDLRLDVEALFSQAIYGHGFLHYGYWPDGEPDTLSLDNLGKAQQAYFDRFVELIPKSVHTILDVGSGTGSNAKGLLEKGFKVDCVCPSAKLNLLAREKLPESTQIFECGFEEFLTEKKYDMALFCESFHYIQAAAALAQANKYVKKYVLIFDYFRRQDSKKGDRITYDTFLRLVKTSPFKILYDEDVTEAITPTFLVLDNLKNNHIKPFSNRVIKEYKKEHPFYSFLLNIPLKKLENSIQRTSKRFQQFPKKHQYRLILMEKTIL